MNMFLYIYIIVLVSIHFPQNLVYVKRCCRKHQLHLCRGLRFSRNECYGYVPKSSDGETSLLELCCILIYIYIGMHNTTKRHNKDERHSLFEKYTSHFIWKGCVWEGVGDRTEPQHIDLHSIGHNHVSFPFSWAAQPGAWGPTLLGAGFLYRNSSDLQTRLIHNWLNFLRAVLYNCSTPTSFLWASKIALIQPVHGQGYILIFLDRMDAPVIYTGAFPILTTRPGQRSIYNSLRNVKYPFITIPLGSTETQSGSTC